jgi:triosephosphate isomerase
MRNKIIAANWKMNLNFAEAMSLADALVDSPADLKNCNVILAGPFIYLHDLVNRVQSRPEFSVAAQNCHTGDKGAFTGEVSAAMLASIGVESVIIGHSERRVLYGEDDSLIAKKISKVLEHGLIPIFCCGENLNQRKSNNQFSVVEQQLEKGLFHIDAKNFSECIVAYEPVWAIGTGVTASVKEIAEMHSFIRSKIVGKYGAEIAEKIPLLYGGSVSPENSGDIFNCSDVDGGLVGGASLKAQSFLAIIESMNHVLKTD